MGRDRSRSRSPRRAGRDASPPRRRRGSPPPRRRDEAPRGESSGRGRSQSPQQQQRPRRAEGDRHRREEGGGKDNRRRSPLLHDRDRDERRRSPPPPRDRERDDRRRSPPPQDRDRDLEGRRGDFGPPRGPPAQQQPQDAERDRGDRWPQWGGEGGGNDARPQRPWAHEGGPPPGDRGGRGGGRGRGRGRRGRGGEEDEGRIQWGNEEVRRQQAEEELPDKEVEPEFGLSGALAAEANKVNGVVLLHTEPPEARKPTHRWRLYIFKKGEPFGDPLHIHRESSYLFGRERRVADIPTDHPSCSKQHAVLQYRLTEKEGADGMMQAAVRPYMMDLGSTNGTFINNERIEAQRYYELLPEDMLRFGNSSREYILLRDDLAKGMSA